MTFYSNMLPVFIVTAVAGALYIASIFQQFKRPVIYGIGIGAVAGLVGPMIFMTPLDSCTFEAGREPIDFWFGIVLFVLGATLLLAAVRWAVNFWLSGEKMADLVEDQTSMGVYKTSPLIPALLLLPTIIILTFFLYYPLIDTFRLSTLLVKLGAPRTVFRCVSNFTSFLEPSGFDNTALALALGLVIALLAYQPLKDAGGFELRAVIIYISAIVIAAMLLNRIIEPEYREVLFNTFFIAAAIVILGLMLGLAIAYLAFQPVKGAFVYRTLLIWPYAISPAIAGLIFFVMFDPVSGMINHIIELLGGTGLDWIRDRWLARAAVIITSVWKTLGYNILFYIAGLQTVPRDHIEAAHLDGANAWQRFRHVVLPALSPITFFLIVTNLTYAFFNIFGTIDFLTKGGPVGATSVSIYEIVELGIRHKDLGRAAAQSIVLFLMVIGVTVFQFRTSGRRVTYGA